MSQGNVEIVRAANRAWNEGDMDTFRDYLDPDVILRTVGNWPEPGPYVGREAVLAFSQSLRGAFDEDRLREAGECAHGGRGGGGLASHRSPRGAFDEDRLREASECVHGADRVVMRLAMDTVGHGPPTSL